jgi:hypothetical protein
MGGWLWATTAMPIAGIAVTIYWLASRRPDLARIIIKPPELNEFDWVSDIWPHQWRLGLNWLSVFFMSQMATPLLFYYCDPVLAGRMGLSLTIVHMLGIISQSWIARRVPVMSQAVAMRDWNLLDRLFKKDLLHSLLVFLLGSLSLILLYELLVNTVYITRVLNFWQFIGLLGFVFFYHINGAFSAQLRSFRREPLMWVSVVGSALILTGTVLEARLGSVEGVVFVMLAVQALFIFPLSFMLWAHYNRVWRNDNLS